MDSQNSNPSVADPLGERSAVALRELQERARVALAARRDHVSRLEADITSRLETITAELAQQQTVDSQQVAQVDDFRAEIEQLRGQLEDAQAASKLERAAWESEREALEKERAATEAERNKFTIERSEWETAQSSFASERAAWENERNAFEAERDAWDSERGALTATAAQASTNLECEHEELQHKFKLALEDVQRFRSRVTELEQEPAQRPATGENDSAEMVALRAERDALVDRIKELEQEQTAGVDANAEQQRSDLQRRFEMAVEDVRELKTKNAKLEAQLTASRKPSGGGSDAGGMDWESQKRRMLASLEGGSDDAGNSASREERASIESTIEMTDAVVAEKDAEIAALKAELTVASSRHDEQRSDDVARDEAVNKLLDADEVIAQHRKKAAQLEQEMEGKLRAAELEISVERAKIARNRAELEELRTELESQRQALGAHGPAPSAGAPKRRWLSKLGLSGDEES